MFVERGFAFMVMIVVCHGDTSTSTTKALSTNSFGSTVTSLQKSNSTEEGNKVAILAKAGNETAQKSTTDFLKLHNLPFELKCNKSDFSSLQQENITASIEMNNKISIINLIFADVTNEMKECDQNGTKPLDVSKVFIIELCSSRNNSLVSNPVLDKLFELMNESFLGFHINFTTAVTSTSNDSLADYINNKMKPKQEYFVTVGNLDQTTRSVMAGRFCSEFVQNPGNGSSTRTPSSEPSTPRPTNVTGASVSTPGANLSTASSNMTASTTANSTLNPNVTTPSVTTVLATTITANVSAEKTTIVGGHPRAAATAIIILLVIVIVIVGVIFRRRILNCVKAKFPRARPIISTLTIAPYGSLRNEYDLEDFGMRRP